jgi:hypothetical protein
MRPTTAVPTAQPEVGVLVDAPSSDVSSLASALAADGIHASFALDRPPADGRLSVLSVLSYGDQAVPRLHGGGLVRWLGTGGTLHRLITAMGFHRHFLYASSGPSVGQWWMAHGAGGRLIAGAVRLDDSDDAVGRLHAGEVIEVTIGGATNLAPMIDKLRVTLATTRLHAVTVGRLMRDAGAPV